MLGEFRRTDNSIPDTDGVIEDSDNDYDAEIEEKPEQEAAENR